MYLLKKLKFQTFFNILFCLLNSPIYAGSLIKAPSLLRWSFLISITHWKTIYLFKKDICTLMVFYCTMPFYFTFNFLRFAICDLPFTFYIYGNILAWPRNHQAEVCWFSSKVINIIIKYRLYFTNYNYYGEIWYSICVWWIKWWNCEIYKFYYF